MGSWSPSKALEREQLPQNTTVCLTISFSVEKLISLKPLLVHSMSDQWNAHVPSQWPQERVWKPRQDGTGLSTEEEAGIGSIYSEWWKWKWQVDVLLITRQKADPA